MTEHRIRFMQRDRALLDGREVLAGRRGNFAHLGIGLGQELVQRRIEQRIVTGSSFMMPKISMKSWRCIGRSLASAFPPPLDIIGHDHLTHRA